MLSPVLGGMGGPLSDLITLWLGIDCPIHAGFALPSPRADCGSRSSSLSRIACREANVSANQDS